MGTIWIKDFRGGLDARKMPETLPGGSAILARDGHLSRGGEFEQRAAFVSEYDLPAGLTVGLGIGISSVYVFGHGVAPTMPLGVTYQRLQHPDGITPIFRILSTELFASKIYAVAEFSDGTIYHYYDGTRVSDWQDGRARTSFLVAGGGQQAAVAATASFTVNGGSSSIVNTIGDIMVNGVAVIAAPVQHTGNNSTTAAAIASAINSMTSSPDYTAAAVGPIVTITAALAGTTPNGFTPVLTLNGDVAITALTAFAGGTVAAPSQLVDITVNSVSILGGAVDWTTSNEATAEAIALQINAYASTPNYTATAVGNKVNILAVDAGATPNGYAVATSVLRNLVLSPSSGVLSDGLAPGSIFQAGTFAKTVGSKMYVAAGPVMNFSGILLPTSFQTSATGAGFIDMSTEAAGSENLQAIVKYLQYIAVFAERVTQIWYVDPDPDQNKQQQVLNNTGTLSPRSVSQFGDSDIFYLDESGVRSLKARNATTAAATDDIGVAVDPLIIAKLQSLTPLQRSQIIGLIEPRDGRFWLVFSDEIFVFSFFASSKVSAWSTYTPAYDNEPFTISDAVVFKKKVHVRTGDKIRVYGGLRAAPEYDSTEPEFWTPYLDADAPTKKKDFSGIDVACEGRWEIRAGMSPKNLAATDKVAIVDSTTYEDDRLPFEHSATHVSLRFKGVGAGYKKVAAAAIHFEPATEKGGD